jgi:LacI family transcriptional regulator
MDDPDNELYFLKVFGQLRVSGLIAAPCPGSKAAGELDFLRKEGVKVVLIDRTLPDFKADYCGFDHHVQAKALTEHLLELGHQRLAVAGASLSYSVIDERKAGFWEAMKASGVAHSSYLEVDLEYDHAPVRMEEHDRNVTKLVDYLGGVRPSALVCALDGLLPSVEEAAARLGLRIPEDLAVFSFDNLHTKVPSSGQITRTYRPGTELGRRSADLLLQRMAAESKNPRNYKRELIEAEHCGWESSVLPSGKS